jgi:phage terminase large subunit-like protein
MGEILAPQAGPQEQFVNMWDDIPLVFYGGAAGGGKALKHGEKVLTISGWKNIEDVSKGEDIYDPHGGVTKVIAKYPQGVVPLYKVTTNDGRTSTCCGDHLWRVRSAGSSTFKVLNTKTMCELLPTLKRNLLIEHTEPVEFTEKELPLDPYLVGCLLGDGSLAGNAVELTSTDKEIIYRIKSSGYDINPVGHSGVQYSIKGIRPSLRLLGMLGKKLVNKEIPSEYKHTSKRQRLDLIQGLMDTDGYVTKDGKMYFYSSSIKLIQDFQYVIRSLGGSATVTEKWVKYKGDRVLSYVCYIKYIQGKELCSISRKSDLCRVKKNHQACAIKSIVPCGEGEATCISVDSPSHLFLTNDFLVTHNSWAILFDALKYVDDPNSYIVFFRNTMKQIERTLWPEAKEMYDPFLKYQTGENKGKFKGKAQIKEQAKTIIFPSGAKVEFSFLDNEAEIKKNWQGAQLTAAYFEEFGNHSEFAFNYIRTRMRSKSKYKSFIRCSLNPEPNHFVIKYLKRFINQKTGLAIREYSGRPAYFIADKGEVFTSWSKEELLEKFPKKNPRLYTFVPSCLADNPAMTKNNEEYEEDLKANDPQNAAILLEGNWLWKPVANGVFDRNTIQIIEHEPIGCTYVRAYDKASSKPSKEGGDSKQLDPDYTASILFAKDRDGFIYVMGNYVKDEDECQIARIREKPGPRDKHIEKQAYFDGVDTTIIMPKDPGQSGVVELQESAKKLQCLGFQVKPDTSISNRSKRLRFEPFASACYTGAIYWVKNSFEQSVWDYMIQELENFDGNKNNGYHDDIVDAFSSAYATIQSTRVRRPMSNATPTATKLAQFKR